MLLILLYISHTYDQIPTNIQPFIISLLTWMYATGGETVVCCAHCCLVTRWCLVQSRCLIREWWINRNLAGMNAKCYNYYKGQLCNINKMENAFNSDKVFPFLPSYPIVSPKQIGNLVSFNRRLIKLPKVLSHNWPQCSCKENKAAQYISLLGLP